MTTANYGKAREFFTIKSAETFTALRERAAQKERNTATIKSPSATSNHLKELNFIMQYFLGRSLFVLLLFVLSQNDHAFNFSPLVDHDEVNLDVELVATCFKTSKLPERLVRAR